MRKTRQWCGMIPVTMVLALALCSCSELSMGVRDTQSKGDDMMEITSRPWGQVNGKDVQLYTLTNGNGMRADITNYGGIVVRLLVPDEEGGIEDVVLGYNELEKYVKKNDPYFGALIGRYANRIRGGTFTLNGNTYQLPQNDGENSLHGGEEGFDQKVWDAEPFESGDAVGVKLHRVSADGEQGYPGRLDCNVTISLTEDNELKFEYHATTNEPTIVNLTHHGYFNLDGQGDGDILDHILMINADHFTPIGETLTPTGEIRSVEGTPLDFTEPTPFGARINQDNKQLEYGNGYDHNYVLNKDDGGLTLAARVKGPDSGRVMEVYTTEPGLQLYSGNFLDGSHVGKHGEVYKNRYGFCLEAQKYPDSPNKPNFPSPVLRPGETYTQTTIYKFEW